LLTETGKLEFISRNWKKIGFANRNWKNKNLSTETGKLEFYSRNWKSKICQQKLEK
jgi:hypothetical protein